MEESPYTYKTYYACVEPLKRGDPSALEPVLYFLEWFLDGQGYLKETYWYYIQRYDLTPDQIAQLERAALKHLTRPMGREFKKMARTMSRIATPAFWERVAHECDSEIPRVQFNAYFLSAYAEGREAGDARRKLIEFRVNRKRVWPDMLTPDELFEVLMQPQVWQGGSPVSFPPDAVPKFRRYEPDYHMKKFMPFNYATLKADEVLPVLEYVLSVGWLGKLIQKSRFASYETWWSSSTLWWGALHVMSQLRDVRIVAMVIHFLEAKVDYKMMVGAEKEFILRQCFEILRQYDLPEARAAIEARQHLIWVEE